jgi:RNA polymerase sigma factor (sigma-70 family)
VKDVSSPILELLRRAVDEGCVRALPDHELLARFRTGHDHAAFHTLLRRHGPMVLDVCRAVLGHEADAEDAFQATFLTLTRKAGSVRKGESLGSWLHGVAYRTSLKARARAAARRQHETRAPAAIAAAPDDLTWPEVRRVLHEELNRLPERCRLPLVLCYLEGRTQEQAADELGLAKSTLRERLERGRELLRGRLVRRGLGPAALLAAAWPAAQATAALPRSLVTATLQAVSPAAAAGASAARAATLTEGVLRTMLRNKIKTAALVILVAVGATAALLPTLAARDGAARQKQTAGPAAQPKAEFPDLTKIDRTLVKEPKYTTEPYYALLTLGPEAKKRVWLVVDGNTLYVDRNGNGDLTEAGERMMPDKKIAVAPGMYKHMNSYYLGELEGICLRLDFWVRDRRFVPTTDFDRQVRRDHEENGWEFATLFRVNADGSDIPAQIPVTFCRQPADAPVCHVGGPLRLFLRWGENGRPFVRGADTNLDVMIGTPGLPPRKWSDPVYAPLATTEVPADLHPVAQIEFPHKDPKQPPLKVEVVLDQRCCGDNFYGPVPVPADAATGKAKVTVSFPAWKAGKVAPATFAVPVIDAPPPVPKKTPGAEQSSAGWHSPDRLPLGTVRVGATVEASFVLYEKGDDARKVPLTVEAPPFVKVLDQAVIDREVFDGNAWIKGVAGVVVVGIDTSKPGAFAGDVKVKLGTVTAKVPVSVVVKPPEPAAARLLVVESPFVAYSTSDAGDFKSWTDLVAEAAWDVSYLTVAQGKPVFRDFDLTRFDVVLLDPDALLSAGADDLKRVRAFVEGGGRLVLAASHAFVGSVEAANKVTEGYGLTMLDEEALYGKNEAILGKKAFGSELTEAGIGSARFYRGSPVVVTDAKRARVLVQAEGVGGPGDGFVAAARAGKGEVLVLGQGLWWSWISADQAQGTDNARLLQLLLTPIGVNRKQLGAGPNALTLPLAVSCGDIPQPRGGRAAGSSALPSG